MKQHINTLLSKEMDRKDFLKYVTAACFMFMGSGMIMRALGDAEKLSGGQKQVSSSAGYGGGAYGGRSSVI